MSAVTSAGTERFDVEPVNSRKQRQPLYAARKKIFPKRASGSFPPPQVAGDGRHASASTTSRPGCAGTAGRIAPDQAVLVDLANRRFYFFFIEIWPQEFYYVAGLLIMAGSGCSSSPRRSAAPGAAMPARRRSGPTSSSVVERAIEGDRNARIKLDAAPWIARQARASGSPSTRSGCVIGVATGGAWIFYFADAPTLLADLVTLQAPAVAYLTVALLTATTYTFGGLLREQVCTYMCPWPRIQAAMLDEHSLTVTYNDWRGEPRSRHAKKALAEGKPVGDCVDCNACVAVCPMGIDIRDGQQLECITCALCIDACDDVMAKLGKERGPDLLCDAQRLQHEHAARDPAASG